MKIVGWKVYFLIPTVLNYSSFSCCFSLIPFRRLFLFWVGVLRMILRKRLDIRNCYGGGVLKYQLVWESADCRLVTWRSEVNGRVTSGVNGKSCPSSRCGAMSEVTLWPRYTGQRPAHSSPTWAELPFFLPSQVEYFIPSRSTLIPSFYSFRVIRWSHAGLACFYYTTVSIIIIHYIMGIHV